MVADVAEIGFHVLHPVQPECMVDRLLEPMVTLLDVMHAGEVRLAEVARLVLLGEEHLLR